MGSELERFCGPRAIRPPVPRSFADALAACVNGIPPSRVATCGTVARSLGDVRAARTVAEWLHAHPEVPGSHRVVRADGRPVLAEAVSLLGEEGSVDSQGRATSDRFVDVLPEVPLLAELRAEQMRLASRVVEEDRSGRIDTWGGVDVSYAGDRAFAVAVTLNAETGEVVETAAREIDVDFPYIPTYLAFREFPPIREALEVLSRLPDLLFVDGHGRLHPVLFGFACYVGVRLDLRTVGVAKHPLAGLPEIKEKTAGGVTPMRLEGRIRGYAWTPPKASRPIYVSVGNHVSLERALAEAQRATKERYPEALRVADRLSKEERKKNVERSASDRAANPRLPAQGHSGV